MKKSFLLATLAIGALCLPCVAQNRIVENPLIEATNTATLDITKIELTDSETILHVDAYFRPRNWIRIVSDTYLKADGQKYTVRSSEGIQLDSLFWMPDSGQASFVMKFPPLPQGVKSFDFIESDCDDCFKLYGVDLTGKAESPRYPEGLPAALKKGPKDGPVPDPVFKVGETTVNVHMLGYREGMFKQVVMYVNSMLGGQKEYTADVDPKSGVATLRFKQYGSSMSYLRLVGGIPAGGCIWSVPGETLDIYYDLGTTGKYLMNRRVKQETTPASKIFSTGAYGDLNALFNMDFPFISLDCYTGKFADYRMSSDEYVEMVESKYKMLTDSISRRDAVPQMVNEIARLTLQQEVLMAANAGRYLLEHNYRAVNNMWDRNAKIDYQFAEFTPEQIARMSNLVDIENPKLLMGSRSLDIGSTVGVKDGVIAELRIASALCSKAENNELTQADIDQLRSFKEPFFAEALEAMQAHTRAELEQVKDVKIEETPAVSEEELFDAIIAPHKGKVIFVDFWNTWCAPCRASIAQTEPLKSDELKSDNLVWIYLANETSPLTTYKTSIPKIQGKHYRLNPAQWKYLSEKFKIDGIPSYVLVEKDGTYSLRNDLRDHNRLKSTLKEKIK